MLHVQWCLGVILILYVREVRGSGQVSFPVSGDSLMASGILYYQSQNP